MEPGFFLPVVKLTAEPQSKHRYDTQPLSHGATTTTPLPPSLPGLNIVERTCWLHRDWPSSLSQLKVTCLTARDWLCVRRLHFKHKQWTWGCNSKTSTPTVTTEGAEKRIIILCFSWSCCSWIRSNFYYLKSKLFLQLTRMLTVEDRPPPGLSGGVGGCGQWRRQLVLLLGGISPVPSTAATNLSAAVICNGKKSKADWGLSAGRGWRDWRRESMQALLLPTVTALLRSVYINIQERRV